jgi:hypothetical protein
MQDIGLHAELVAESRYFFEQLVVLRGRITDQIV